MLTLFNRKELIATYDIKKQALVRSVLSEAGIEYQVRVLNRRSSSAFSAGTRAYTGGLGENPEFWNEYCIFVKKKDYDRARTLI